MAQHDGSHDFAASKMIAILTSSLSDPQGAGIGARVSDAAMERLNSGVAKERRRSQREERELHWYFGGRAVGDDSFKTVNDIVEAAVESDKTKDWTRAMAALAAYALDQELPMVAAAQILAAHGVPLELLDKPCIDALFIPIRDEIMEHDDPQDLMNFDIARHFGTSEAESLELWEQVWNRVEAASLGIPLAPR